MGDSEIAGFVLALLGGFQAVRPDLVVRLQIWTQRAIMGARYEPSARTFTVTRAIGAGIVLLGLLLITRIIE